MPERFIELLEEATAQIPRHYFQLPVAGKEDPIYRERVYCYELYHQLRPLIERDPALADFALSGEIDKGGHPVIRRCTPDFVFHEPGDKYRNLVVVEVKPINASDAGIKKDLETLVHFVSPDVGYQLGVQLVYGDGEGRFKKFVRIYQEAGHPQLRLYWHRHCGERAQRVL